MLRVLVADVYEVVRIGVRRLIQSHPGWELAGEASDGREALELALREKPDVVVVEVDLPGINGVLLAQHLRHDAPATSVLLYTTREDDETICAGLEAGARGYVLKTDSAHDLEAAISALAARRLHFSPRVSELLLDAATNGHKKSRLQAFTIRELEVARLMAEGNRNKQIAGLLDISIKTVESHRAAAMRKAGTRTAAEFVRFAIRQSLILAR
jgi:DNA-binding NarL/FixJ family response regulator